jgi:hypothetical protein
MSSNVVTRDQLLKMCQSLEDTNHMLRDMQIVLSECQQQLERNTVSQRHLNTVIDPFRVALCAKRSPPQ